MAFRTEKAVGAVIGLLLAGSAFGAEFRYNAVHGHLRKGGNGTLVIGDSGVSFRESGKKKEHAWNWAFQDIQQLEIGKKTLRVLTYRDDKWKLGADRGYRFDLAPGQDFTPAYEFLKSRLDQRFVAALADSDAKPLWRIPVKHALRFSGSEGELLVTGDGVVYATEKPGESRTWRYPDIENVSSSGPFQLTITTYERAKAHYGNLKGFNFQLKEPLKDTQYNDLWRRVNEAKGLQFISSYTQERKENQ